MDIITGHLNLTVLGIALAIFVVYGLILPWRDRGKFVHATLKYAPKVQCLALTAVGYGATSFTGTVADWFNDGRAWLLERVTEGANWALGGVGVLAVAVAAVFLLADYIAPGGLEPNSGKPSGHLLMWIVSVLVYPLLNIALGSISLFSLCTVFVAMWFINVKFRTKKGGKRETADASS